MSEAVTSGPRPHSHMTIRDRLSKNIRGPAGGKFGSSCANELPHSGARCLLKACHTKADSPSRIYFDSLGVVPISCGSQVFSAFLVSVTLVSVHPRRQQFT